MHVRHYSIQREKKPDKIHLRLLADSIRIWGNIRQDKDDYFCACHAYINAVNCLFKCAFELLGIGGMILILHWFYPKIIRSLPHLYEQSLFWHWTPNKSSNLDASQLSSDCPTGVTSNRIHSFPINIQSICTFFNHCKLFFVFAFLSWVESVRAHIKILTIILGITFIPKHKRYYSNRLKITSYTFYEW